MNPSEHELERLLEAAQAAREPIPGPSPWFEQKLIQALKQEADPLHDLIESRWIIRLLIGAAALMAVSVILPFVQVKNPYVETVDAANATAQMEKIP